MEFLKPFYPTWDDALAAHLLSQFQLPLNRKLRHLSRGMRMKAALASSLAYRPKLIVRDEPFTGLDVLVRDEPSKACWRTRRTRRSSFRPTTWPRSKASPATLVIWMADGCKFAEELEALSARFREIVVTFEGPPALPVNAPPAWMHFEPSAWVVRFIDTQFNPERTPAQVREFFAGVRDISANGMPLRSIFVTLAKANRAAAA
jgi:ABC-2 type transport system ATP-binding protein